MSIKFCGAQVRPLTAIELVEKFHANYIVVLTSDCWEWQGHINNDGYGTIYIGNQKHEKAHRFSYELHKGPIPEGLTIDHLCRNRCCVNPGHLEAVPHKINLLRGDCPTAINARKSICIRGHSLAPDNIYKEGNGRRCKQCHAAKQKRLRLKRSSNGATDIQSYAYGQLG